MIITKKPASPAGPRLPFRYFPRARDAFEHVLRSKACRGRTVLLPAYIGWGKVEGSGVFDPVRRARKPFVFYRMTDRLEIDVASLTDVLTKHPRAVLLLIHYFGFKDPSLARVKGLAAERDCVVVEDFAHGLYTFFADPALDFDHAFFSLHKMLPYRNRTGGLLLSSHGGPRGREYVGFFRHNLGLIARRRRENYAAALERLQAVAPPGVTILRSSLGANVPESFPILLPNREKRNLVHARMNARGFGLISLYHELIAEIDDAFPTEREISDRITNLPIHQDAALSNIRPMIDSLGEVLSEIG